MTKQKPTKVTKEDIELAEELSRITTIKALLDQFSTGLDQHFAEMIEVAYTGNAVAMYITIENKRNELEAAAQYLQADLLEILGGLDEVEAEELAEQESENEVQISSVQIVEAVEAVNEFTTPKHTEIDEEDEVQ